MATVLLPPDHINQAVIAQFIPGTQKHEARRCWIGNISSEDDVANIENFDEALKRIRKKENRIITVILIHNKVEFELAVAFSFLGSDNPGDIFEVKTEADGKTYLEVLAVL